MKPEVWKRVNELFAGAQERPADQRAAFLDNACGGDQELRAEVESLLRAAGSADSFMEDSPVVPPDQPALKPGDKLGVFEIIERIGRGGMGEVYRARDSRLMRDVAIKVLPPELAEDPGRLRRFEQEARAASALKHPNIVSVYDVGSTGGISWMVTELVEGRSLREVLAKGAISPRKAAEIAAQIADGLVIAHASGLVHRDLKAENVMLAPRDLVKILDFGIAKRKVAGAAGAPLNALTKAGELVGTPASMSPEQVEGEDVDHRSDIFSLGVLLYEMLSGHRPFSGETRAGVMNAIVNQEPADLPAAVPQAVAGIVHRCLEKLPERRFQSAADLAYALRTAIPSGREGRRKRSRRPIMFVAAAGALLAAAGAFYWSLAPGMSPPDLHSVPLMQFPARAYYPSLSPEGNKVAFHTDSPGHIYVAQIGSGAPPVQLTRGPNDDFCAEWSPDDRFIAFIRVVGAGEALMLMPSIGGTERKVSDLPAGAGQLFWTPDSKWLALPLRDSPKDPSSIWLISVSTGERRRLTKPAAGSLDDSWPSISPDGRSLAFIRELTTFSGAPFVLTLAKDYRPEGQPRELTAMRYADVGGTAWTADGREIVFSGGPPLNKSLYRVPASGRHAPVRLPYALPIAMRPIISRTRSRLAYMRVTWDVNFWRLDTRTGERKILVGSNDISQIPQYSPDGRKIAFQSNRSGQMGVWTCDADGSNCGQLTAFGNALGGSPRWSPDSRWIAFDSHAEGASHIYVIQADGGPQRRVTNGPADDMIPSWSRDGRWIYFASNRTGRIETWKIPAAGGTAIQVTHEGGGPAFESVNGGYLYYYDFQKGPLLRMRVDGGPASQVLPRVSDWWAFDIAPKGVYFTADGKTIRRLEFSSGKLSTLAVVERVFGLGLCVSPDEAFVVWPQIDQTTSELMLVEGFR